MAATTSFAPLHLITAVTDEKGRLINAETGHLLKIEPGAPVRLLLDPAHVREISTRAQVVMRNGDLLHFDLLGLPGGSARVTLKLLMDATMYRRHDQYHYLFYNTPCRIETVTLPDGSTPADFEPTSAPTIGLAYRWASERYQPHRASHTTDIYTYIRTADGTPLGKLWQEGNSDFYDLD